MSNTVPAEQAAAAPPPAAEARVLRVGLTGGIACGKSRVRRRLAAAGFGTLDLDAVAHEMIAPGGPAYDDVVAAFGRGILAADGTVDRKALGARVFADAAARAELNALVHPRVRDEEARRAAAHAAAGGRVFVTDAALLVEAGLHLRFDRLVVVDCEGGEQLRRLVARDGIDEAAARARIEAQMPAAEKRRFAHIALDASGTPGSHGRGRGAARPPSSRSWPSIRPRARRVRETAVRGALLAGGPAHGPRGLDPARFATERRRRRRRGDGAAQARCSCRQSTGPWYLAAQPTAAREPGTGSAGPGRRPLVARPSRPRSGADGRGHVLRGLSDRRRRRRARRAPACSRSRPHIWAPAPGAPTPTAKPGRRRRRGGPSAGAVLGGGHGRGRPARSDRSREGPRGRGRSRHRSPPGRRLDRVRHRRVGSEAPPAVVAAARALVGMAADGRPT